ncbi:MAG: GntR family transcriptional regulator [Actinobacteria bacterium]|nr:GntR family transcriptional regulator [Actinomycetota bacterium]
MEHDTGRMTDHQESAGQDMPDKINRGEAPYRQIARHYREQIDKGVMKPGDLMPSVRAMAQRWEVAHTTANRALRMLQAEGLVMSGPGVGTVVTPQAPTAEALVTHLRQTGAFYPPGYRSEITEAGLTSASERIADALGLETGDQVITRSRVTYDADGNPVEDSTNYMRGEFAEAAPALLEREPIPNGMLGYLEAKTGRRATTGCDQYAAFLATTDQATKLRLKAGDAVLIERHWWTDDEGTVLDYAESVEPGGKWRTHRYRVPDSAP